MDLVDHGYHQVSPTDILVKRLASVVRDTRRGPLFRLLPKRGSSVARCGESLTRIISMSDEQALPPAAWHPAVKTICIVEDDESIGDFLVQALAQETPYEVVWISDALRAVELVKVLKPSLLLLDFLLPGINGIELYERLHAIPELEQTPAILLTASFPPRDRMRKLGLPLLQKPFDLDELLLAIQQLLH